MGLTRAISVHPSKLRLYAIETLRRGTVLFLHSYIKGMHQSGVLMFSGDLKRNVYYIHDLL